MIKENSRKYYHYIYLITNLLNKKTYIGQRKCLIDILPERDISYMGSGKLIKLAINKHGVENFNKDILAICSTRDVANILEIEYIKLYREIGKAEYNIADGGVISQNEKMIETIRESVIKHYNSPEGLITRKKLSESCKGRKLSDETKRKLRVIADRESLLAKMSPYNWKMDILTYWKETPKVKTKAIIENDGKYHWYHCGTENVRAKECPPGFEPGRYVSHKSSEETKKKQSDWWKNLSEEEKEEHRRKLREARKNRVFTAETCRKISATKKGKPGRKQSEETRKKISDTLKGRTRTWGARDDRENS